jgi:hypothetical protein
MGMSEGPPPPPPGYKVIEKDGKFFPVRHDGGYTTDAIFHNDGKETKLSGRVIYDAGGVAYETFDRFGEDLSYDHEFPARYFLVKWVDFCGGEHLFHAAWSFYQSQGVPTISLSLEEARTDYARKAKAYEVTSTLLNDWASGAINKETVAYVLRYISNPEESGVSPELAAIYAEAYERIKDILA